ncbi:hypothetical protein D3C73_799010 [compost metagenome]
MQFRLHDAGTVSIGDQKLACNFSALPFAGSIIERNAASPMQKLRREVRDPPDLARMKVLGLHIQRNFTVAEDRQREWFCQRLSILGICHRTEDSIAKPGEIQHIDGKRTIGFEAGGATID